MAFHSGPVGSTELLVEIERGGEIPLHEQVERAIRDGVRAGRLAPGTRLPSTRALAAELEVSRGVVTEAYGQLAAEGYLLMRQGAPVRVARAVRPPRQPASSPSFPPTHQYPFDPTLPDISSFPRDHWLRSLRFAWRQAPIDAIGYPDPRGLPALRQSLADYLGRARGAAADPEQILVCTGFTQGFSLLCRWLAERGVGEIALEDPSWHRQRLIAEQAGLGVVPVAVDAEGIDVEALAASGASAVVVTPAHQFPTGRVLSSERRAALIEWAEAGEGLIVEDDFDAEYRYDRAGVGALQGLAPERVAYIGSASKRLAPGVRLGWALLPSWLAWQLTPAKDLADAGSEVVGQLALHDFIERGELDRHIRRTRLRYQRRREALLAALTRWLPDAQVGDGAAGLFELVRLPAETDESAAISGAAALGVGVEGLGLHRFAASGEPALVIGFGCLPEPAIERGVRLLAQAVGEATVPG
jgi:GntR family transcriptional regulator/MocR family aminotransferase